MKRFFLCGFCLLHLHALAGVVAYWRFEENGGDIAYDEMGNFDAYLYNFANTFPNGGNSIYSGWGTNVPASIVAQNRLENNGALHLSGSSSLDFTRNNDMLMNLGTSFTIECFFNLDYILTGTSIIGMGNEFGGSAFSLSMTQEADGIAIHVNLTGLPNDNYTDPLAISFGEWYHCTFVKDEETGYLYLDGMLVWQETLYGTALYPYVFGFGGFWTRQIGAFTGWLDEIRISDVALSPKDFLNYYAAVPEPGTLALLALGGCVLLSSKKRRKC